MKRFLFSVRKLVSTAHVYHQPKWSEEENQTHFGSCFSKHGHGHNYEIDFSWSLPEKFVNSTKTNGELLHGLEGLAEMAMSDVCTLYDHHHISYTHPKFQIGSKIPTTENLVLQIWEEFQSFWSRRAAIAPDLAPAPSGVMLWEMESLAATFGNTPVSSIISRPKIMVVDMSITLGASKVPYSIQIQTDYSASDAQRLTSVVRERSKYAEHLINLARETSLEIKAPVLIRDANFQHVFSS